MATLLMNPRKRRKRKAVAAPKKRRRITRSRKAPTRRRKYKRNPISAMGGVAGKFIDGAIGGAGALAVDVAMQKLPIPVQFTTGPMGAAAKGVVGLGLGMVVGKFLGQRKLGAQLAQGAITVAMYETSKTMIGPAIGLGGSNDLMYYDNSGMGYINPSEVYPPESVDYYQDDNDDF